MGKVTNTRDSLPCVQRKRYVLAFRLGTSTGYLTPFFREMLEHSSAASASCGTHFGLTKLVTSTCCSPAATRPSTSSIFVASDTCMNCLLWQLCQSDIDCVLALHSLCYTRCFSFCNPSRGETSTRVTSVGRSKFPNFCVSKEFVVRVFVSKDPIACLMISTITHRFAVIMQPKPINAQRRRHARELLCQAGLSQHCPGQHMLSLLSNQRPGASSPSRACSVGLQCRLTKLEVDSLVSEQKMKVHRSYGHEDCQMAKLADQTAH